jgi:DNA gyrase subunit B
MKEKKDKKYTSEDIRVLKFPENVRTRPTMYISFLEMPGIYHLLKEAVDNAVDEFNAGHGKTVTIKISNTQGYVYVEDEGRGIPTDNPSKFYSIFNELHSGGKFDNNSYSNSSGLNGVGLSCINALSTKLSVLVSRNKTVKVSQFKQGILTVELADSKQPKKQGTVLQFYPDLEIFRIPKMDFDFSELSSYFRRLSFLNAGLEFKLTDIDNKKVYSFKSENGIQDYLNFLMKGDKVISNDVQYSGSSEDKKNTASIILNYTSEADEEVIRPFCNSIWNSEGGTHVTGFKMGLVLAFKNFIKEQNLIPKKADIVLEDISGEDIREGLVAIIDLKHSEPLYASQTKLQLTNRDTQGFIQKLTTDSIYAWLTKNLNEGKKLATKIIDNTISRKLVKKAKDSAKKSSILKSSKLSDCNGSDPTQNELWLVEGKLMPSLNLVNCWKPLRALRTTT